MKIGEIISNEELQKNYFLAKFYAPGICETARPGQFVHVRIDHHGDHILRRPFSIHNVESDGTLSIIYKVVGHGTHTLSQLPVGSCCDLLGPLGNPFSCTIADATPVLVAGGYGAAATYLLTKFVPQRGIFLIGARSEADVLLTESYRKSGYEVQIATNDGSVGEKGLVTELVKKLFAQNPNKKFFFYGCGPHPMLMALAKILNEHGQKGELSIDHLMCCGVGACFSCVVKIKAATATGWQYARACTEGPVFNLDSVYVE